MKIKRVLLAALSAIVAFYLFAGCGDRKEPGQGGEKEGITWSGTENVSISRGDNFDLLEGVKAVDAGDGDISDSIVVKDDGDFDTEYSGRYTVVYEAINSKGIISRANREISVQVAHNVANGTFAYPSNAWKFDVPGGNGSAKVVDEEQHFTITNPGNQWWSIQFYQLNVYFTKGETYRLTFDAKSPQGHSISAGFEEVNNNNRMMQTGVKVMRLTQEFQKYELVYTSDADVMNTKVVIYLGWQLPTDDATAESPHEVIIDNVYVEKLEQSGGPVFSGADKATVVSGNHDFDPRQGVTCKDADGKDVDFTVTGEIPDYVQKGCTYLALYSAEDSAGRKTYLLREVEFVISTEFPYQMINSDFSEGFMGWTREINQVQGTGKAEYIEDKENGTVSIKVLDPSEADFHIQLFQDSPRFKKGETYRVVAVVKASAARKIKFEVTDSANDYANIAEPLVAELTTEFKTFTFEFTPDKDCNTVKVGALLGNVDGGVAKGITVTFDKFEIVKVG